MRKTKPPVGWEHVKNCFLVPNELLDFDLPGGSIAVYIFLLRHADRRTGQCHPSTATMAKNLHYCRNTVASYVRLLEERGLIVTEHTKIITKNGIKKNGSLLYTIIPLVFHRVEVFLISGEDEGVVRLSLDTQRHAEDFIPIFIAPRLCRRKIAAVDPHIRRQQAAGVGDKGTVPGIVVPLRVNKETVLSLRIEDEQAVPGSLIVSDSIFVLCDEIIVSQQCAAELPEPRAWQLDDLSPGARPAQGQPERYRRQ